MKKIFLLLALIMTSFVLIGKAQADIWCGDLGTCDNNQPPAIECQYKTRGECLAHLTSPDDDCYQQGSCWYIDFHLSSCNGTTTFDTASCGGKISHGYTCVKDGNCYVLQRDTITDSDCQSEFSNSTCMADRCPMPRIDSETCVEKPSSVFSGSSCYCLEQKKGMTDASCQLEFSNNTCRANSCPMPTSEGETCVTKTGSNGECYCLEKGSATTQTVSSCPVGTSLSTDKCCCIPQ